MAYKALYREFRPRRFSDLKGQDIIAAILKNQVKLGEPSHAYLFSGPRGTGKTSTAKILAAALNCLNPRDGEPCLTCENCIAALNDSMIDIIEMDAASNNGVDNARDIRDKAGLLPAKGKYKVYIVDEVHMLTNQAFNALLKTLEEPPSHVVFILATTEIAALPKTVLSRCQRFDFKFIDNRHIVERMQQILQGMEISADEEALYAIAGASEGAMRDALTILEKCCSFSNHITEAVVSGVLGYAEKKSMYQLFYAIADYDERAAFSVLSQILDAGIESGALAAQMMRGYEQMLLAAVQGNSEDKLMAELAQKLGKKGILRALDIFADAQNRMRFAPKPSILLEAALMRVLLPESENQHAAAEAERVSKIESRLARLENSLVAVAGNVQPTPKAKGDGISRESSEPQKEKNRTEIKRESGTPGSVWNWILQEYAQDFSAKPIFGGLTLVSEEGTLIRLSAASPMIRLMVENGGLKTEIEEKYEAAFAKKIRLEVVDAFAGRDQLKEKNIIDIID